MGDLQSVYLSQSPSNFPILSVKLCTLSVLGYMFPLSETILSIHVFKLSPGDQLFSMCSLHIYDIVKLLKTIFLLRSSS